MSMKTCLAIVMTILPLSLVGRAEVVEEETWYNADGKVVKTVKRVLTGADANRSSDWEPAWVIRERNRDSRVGRSWYSGRSFGSRSYGGRSYWGSRYYVPAYGYSCGSRRVGGLRGYYHRHGGRSHWGIGYCGSGVSILYRR